MNKIRALAFDLDGTLLPYGAKKIPQRVIRVLNSLKDEFYLFLVTGRHALELENIDGIDFDAYITSNGQILSTKEGYYSINSIEKDDIRNLLDYLKDHELSCAFTEADDYYINYLNEKARNYHSYVVFNVPKIKDVNIAMDHDVIIVTAFVREDELKIISELMPHTKYVSWNSYGYDFVSKDSGKGYGLKKTLDHYGLKREEVLCFGDGDNDLDMFEACAYSCAMCNSADFVKAKATYVTTHVRRSGIINGLKYFKIIGGEE